MLNLGHKKSRLLVFSVDWVFKIKVILISFNIFTLLNYQQAITFFAFYLCLSTLQIKKLNRN